MSRLQRRAWPASLWHRLSWGLAFTPLVFAVLVSVDVTAALAIAAAFAPEAFVIVAVFALLFLLGRRILRGVRRGVTPPG
ncbi:MAG: hypothetical protein M3170_09340 [Candidatus Dormibacteraeota bacterium]|nr:hypothetical protein [Candidatus Dormibacteraeota bacterium]